MLTGDPCSVGAVYSCDEHCTAEVHCVVGLHVLHCPGAVWAVLCATNYLQPLNSSDT